MAVCCLMGPLSAVGREPPLGATPLSRGADVVNAKEHEVKAAFLYNFLKFVEWPAARFQETNAPLVIGVVGTSPITAALEATVRNRTINGRPLVVKAVKTPEEARAVLSLFVPGSEDERLEAWLTSLNGSSVLTVGESAAFAKQGGIINFVLDGDKLRFEINMDVARRAGLKISAQLQKLARIRRKE